MIRSARCFLAGIFGFQFADGRDVSQSDLLLERLRSMDTDHHKSQCETDHVGKQRRHCCNILTQAGMSRNVWRVQFEDE